MHNDREKHSDIGFEKKLGCTCPGQLDYEQVVLGLIFLTYISDKFEARTIVSKRKAKAKREPGHYMAYNILSRHPGGGRYHSAHAEYRHGLTNPCVLLDRENKRLKDILPKTARPWTSAGWAMWWTCSRRPGCSEHSEHKDVLGRTYEYCLSKFAEQEGKHFFYGMRRTHWMNALKQIMWTLLLALALLAIPRLSGWVASLFDYRAVDPDGVYAWISVHHIAQALIVLFIIFLASRVRPLDFGFSRGDAKAGRRYVLLFTAIFGAGSLISNLITILAGSFQPFPYPLTTANVAGQMGSNYCCQARQKSLFSGHSLSPCSRFLSGTGS